MSSAANSVRSDESFTLRPVSDDEWSILAWLWQSYRHDLAKIVNGFPYADGRYQAATLNQFPMTDGVAYLAWRPHPKIGDDAPIAFALIKGLTGERRSIEGFWVTPAARGAGIGMTLAKRVLSLHEGPWVIAFQHDNVGAGVFWRRVANSVFGREQWSEEMRAVPGLPAAAFDHFIQSN